MAKFTLSFPHSSVIAFLSCAVLRCTIVARRMHGPPFPHFIRALIGN